MDDSPQDPLPITCPGEREPDPWLRGVKGSVAVVSSWLFFTPQVPLSRGLGDLWDWRLHRSRMPPPRSRQALAWMAAMHAPQAAPAAECARPLLQGPLLVWGQERGFSPKIRGRVKGREMTGEINEHTTSMFDWRQGGLRRAPGWMHTRDRGEA